MKTQSRLPTLSEMEKLIEQAEHCLHDSPTPVFEFTPGGVEVVSDLPWWNGKPLTPETVHEWKEIVTSYQAVPHRHDD